MIPLKFNHTFHQKQAQLYTKPTSFTSHRKINKQQLQQTSIICKAKAKTKKQEVEIKEVQEQEQQEQQQQEQELEQQQSHYKQEPTLICSSITATNVADALNLVELGTNLNCDVLEFRMDCLLFEDYSFEQFDDALTQFQEKCSLPYIVTLRPQWEGGAYTGDENLRLKVLFRAMELQAPYVDVELKALGDFQLLMEQKKFKRDKSNTKLIVSYHNFESTPNRSDTMALLLAMSGNQGVDIVKAAFYAQDVKDAVMLLEVMRILKVDYRVKKPMICLSMGERGQPARILAGKYGGYLTFGALDQGFESAPGQPTVTQLRDLYRVHQINEETKVYGIVGNPVSHSKSPLLHNTAMAHIGFNGVYIPYLVDNMQLFTESYNDLEFAGFSVTIPHKQEAKRLADDLDPITRKIGAVNTLIRQEDGSLMGYNTDWTAAISAIEQGVEAVTGSRDLHGKKVVVIGAGGAGRALVFGAMCKGAQVYVANRSLSRAEQLLKEAPGAIFVPLEKLWRGEVSGDVLANSTSLGMHPDVDQSPVPDYVTQNFSVVFDAVYNPMDTKLLQEAKANGCVCVSGVAMFVGQAAQQFELFTGEEAPLELMNNVVIDSLS
eukprot:TRINITY_DN4172_c0_g2_i2.p1 TRINITY_DN4172_c0_g2~~TRINITY_DN4172_c0_g2_i2.p1  ORF type:complete len:605 (-),score=100.90 TRINITY_DN4172_c0_g2_i2:126-1940(-)